MALVVIIMAVGTAYPKLAPPKLDEVPALPGVSLAAVLVGAFVSVMAYFFFMSLEALVTNLAVAPLVIHAQLHAFRQG